MKPVSKFLICAAIAIVALACSYLIYYTWSISFGEVDLNEVNNMKEFTFRGTSQGDIGSTQKSLSAVEDDQEEIDIDFKAHKNFHLFNHPNCGKFKNGIQDRVVNGEPAKFLANPWIVALSYLKSNGNVEIKCAGTLISGEDSTDKTKFKKKLFEKINNSLKILQIILEVILKLI